MTRRVPERAFPADKQALVWPEETEGTEGWRALAASWGNDGAHEELTAGQRLEAGKLEREKVLQKRSQDACEMPPSIHRERVLVAAEHGMYRARADRDHRHQRPSH